MITVRGAKIEVEHIGRSGGPTLVFLHEGLGSLDLWRDFPRRVSEATGLPASPSRNNANISASRSSSPGREIRRRRKRPSSTKPSFRGTAALRSFVGSTRISIRSAPQSSSPTRASAAVTSVAYPWPIAEARTQ